MLKLIRINWENEKIYHSFTSKFQETETETANLIPKTVFVCLKVRLS